MNRSDESRFGSDSSLWNGNVVQRKWESPRTFEMTSPSQVPLSLEDCSTSPAYHRNPSPPKEVIGLSDSIGGTAFSRHWLFTTLMKLIEVIEKPVETIESEKTEDQNGSVKPPDGAATGETKRTAVRDRLTSTDHRVIDISDELQDELCQLWDMSSDEDVAKLLDEFKATDILTEVISKSDAPRATEIAVGILGNMACTTSVCDSMSTNSALVDLSLCMLSNVDVPTLVELTRFLTTVLSNSKTRPVWMSQWSSDTQSRDKLVFILRSSINKDLLENTAHLLDTLMDLSDELASTWSTVELLQAIVEALRQIGLSPDEGTCSLLHSLQLMSTQTSGVSAILDLVELTTDVLLEFLVTVCQDEIVNLEGTRAAAVASVVSVLDTILMSSPAGYSLLYSSEKCIRCVLKVTYACDKEIVVIGTPKIITTSSENDSNSLSIATPPAEGGLKRSPRPAVNSGGGDNSQLIETLRDTLYTLLCDTIQVMKKEEVDIPADSTAIDEEEGDRHNRGIENTTPSVLKYLNRDCERARIHSLVSMILSHDSGQELLEDLLHLVEKYKLRRLSDIVLDSFPVVSTATSSSSNSPAPSQSPSHVS